MQTYPALFYTSNTPITVGMRECAFERYLGYHAGRHGTGYRRISQAVPLATGAAVHSGMEKVGGWILEYHAKYPSARLLQVPDDVVAWAASEAADEYEQSARSRGLELTKTDLDATAAVDQLILEQKTLIEAQVWIYCLGRLPFMLSRARLINVEHEESPVLDCSCGLGDWVGDHTHHAARGCGGIVMQGRADFIWETLDSPSVLEYEEFKTKATPNYGWEQQWEHSGQLRINMEAASKRLGKEVSQAYVPVLYKGQRQKIDRDNAMSPKIQQTPLVWPWFDAGALPLRAPSWASQWKSVDDWGKGHTLPKTFKRVPIWDEANELPSSNPNGVVFRTDASRVERWVRGWIAPGQLSTFLQVLGPFPKPRTLMDDASRSIVVNETEWREKVAYLRSAGVFEPGDVGAAPEVPVGVLVPVRAADVIPRSWACTKFDGTPCQFKRVCHREPGWYSIETIGQYEFRTPHHAQEQAEFERLGVVFPVHAGEEEAE